MRINDTKNYEKVKNSITMKNLKKILDEKNISVTKLSQFSEITLTESSILAYGNGQKIPSVPVLVSICNYLDVNMDFILDRTNIPTKVDDIDSSNNTEELNMLFYKIKSLPNDKRKLVDAYVRGLLDK